MVRMVRMVRMARMVRMVRMARISEKNVSTFKRQNAAPEGKGKARCRVRAEKLNERPAPSIQRGVQRLRR